MKTLLSALLLLAPAAAQADEPAKVVVVPFAPLGGDVPNNAGSKAADVLATTLKSHDGLAVKLAGAGEADDPASHLKKAQALSADARNDLDAGQPVAAKAKLQQVLEELAAGAAAMDDAEPLADAHAALSRALYQSGDDAKGLIELQRAEALHPGKEFPETRTSPLFAALAKHAEQKVLSAEKSKLKIGSIPPGASAKVDGLDAGRTPVLFRELPPGEHLWRVDLPSGGSVGGVVDVKAGATAEVTGAAIAKGPASPLVAQLAANNLTQASMASMKDAASGLDAQWLVFGGLHVEGSDLVLDSFVYAPKSNGFARLPKVKFDQDLLTAGQELAKVASDVAGRAGSATLGAAAKLPQKVSDTSSSEVIDLSEFRFPAAGTDEAQPKHDTGPRKVVGARKGPVTKQQ